MWFSGFLMRLAEGAQILSAIVRPNASKTARRRAVFRFQFGDQHNRELHCPLTKNITGKGVLETDVGRSPSMHMSLWYENEIFVPT